MISRRASTAARVIKGTIRRDMPSKVALWLTPEAVKRVKCLLSKQPETTALKVYFQFISQLDIGDERQGRLVSFFEKTEKIC